MCDCVLYKIKLIDWLTFRPEHCHLELWYIWCQFYLMHQITTLNQAYFFFILWKCIINQHEMIQEVINSIQPATRGLTRCCGFLAQADHLSLFFFMQFPVISATGSFIMYCKETHHFHPQSTMLCFLFFPATQSVVVFIKNKNKKAQ